METLHAEGDSPFEVKENGDNGDNGMKGDEELVYVDCPVDGCGEVLLLGEMEFHIELHAHEAGPNLDTELASSSDHSARPSTSSSSPSRSHRDAERQRRAESAVSSRQAKAISALKKLLKMPNSTSALSSRHRKDVKPAATTEASRGKRLGVSNTNVERRPGED